MVETSHQFLSTLFPWIPSCRCQDLSLKLRVAKTGVAEARAAPKRGTPPRRKDQRQRRAAEKTPRVGATGAVAKMGCWGCGAMTCLEDQDNIFLHVLGRLAV